MEVINHKPDPMAIKRVNERLLICRLLLHSGIEMYQTFNAPKTEFGTHIDTLYTGMCVALGHMEGKPFSVSKLASFMQCPRTTVRRRLKMLIDDGLVERHGTKYLANVERLNAPRTLRCVSKVKALIVDTANQLAKMDTFD